MNKLAKEAIVFGVIILVTYSLLININKNCFDNYEPSQNEKYIIAFFTGITLHLFCEFTGINKNYCKYGNACS
jgi:hypothetical protein